MLKLYCEMQELNSCIKMFIERSFDRRLIGKARERMNTDPLLLVFLAAISPVPSAILLICYVYWLSHCHLHHILGLPLVLLKGTCAMSVEWGRSRNWLRGTSTGS